MYFSTIVLSDSFSVVKQFICTSLNVTVYIDSGDIVIESVYFRIDCIIFPCILVLKVEVVQQFIDYRAKIVCFVVVVFSLISFWVVCRLG